MGNHEESLLKLLSEPGFYLYGSKFPIDVRNIHFIFNVDCYVSQKYFCRL